MGDILLKLEGKSVRRLEVKRLNATAFYITTLTQTIFEQHRFPLYKLAVYRYDECVLQHLLWPHRTNYCSYRPASSHTPSCSRTEETNPNQSRYQFIDPPGGADGLIYRNNYK